MKVVVTGGAGFIGSHIVDALVARGDEVAVIDDLSTGKPENVSPAARLFEMDIRDRGLDRVFSEFRPEAVFHEAAQVSVRNSVDDPVADADINVLGSLNVIRCSVALGIKRFIFASSGGAVYGEQEVFPAPETHPAWPVSPYGIGKMAIEKYLFYFNLEYGLDYTALRYSNVYGPRQDPYGEAGVVAIFTEKMLGGETPVINGDGEQTRDYVYVGDVVAANLAALDGSCNGALNVGTGVETSVNELFGILGGKTGYAGEKVHGPAKPGEQTRSVIDCGLIRDRLGWEPVTSLYDGLGMTVDYFRSRKG